MFSTKFLSELKSTCIICTYMMNIDTEYTIMSAFLLSLSIRKVSVIIRLNLNVYSFRTVLSVKIN